MEISCTHTYRSLPGAWVPVTYCRLRRPLARIFPVRKVLTRDRPIFESWNSRRPDPTCASLVSVVNTSFDGPYGYKSALTGVRRTARYVKMQAAGDAAGHVDGFGDDVIGMDALFADTGSEGGTANGNDRNGATESIGPGSQQLAKSPTAKRVLLNAQCKEEVAVKEIEGAAVTLTDYMTLPPEQYAELGPGGTVTRLSGSKFRLEAPPLDIFNINAQAVLDLEVKLLRPRTPLGSQRVQIVATNCTLRGSPALDRWQLDKLMRVEWITELSWKSKAGSGGKSASKIIGSSKLNIWCEIVGAFQQVPPSLLKSVANMVLRRAFPVLFNIFLDQLAADFQKWEREPEYRALRAAKYSGVQPGSPAMDSNAQHVGLD